MRAVVACSHCRRQWDATGWTPGSRFRCECGSVLSVVASTPHDAAVVRCSSCGAGRRGQALSCGHCGADFTLHARDLQSMCGHCLSRISSAARFCHHCGMTATVTPLPQTTTGTPCPACGPQTRLHTRSLSARGHVGEECRRCAGLWLDHTTFEHIVGHAKRQAVAGLGPAEARGASAPQSGPMYRRCPRCSATMNRRNYGRRSDVVIDVCRHHGIWFDAGELARILRWVQAGGHERAAVLDAQHARLTSEESKLRRQRSEGVLEDASGHGALGHFVSRLSRLLDV